VQWNELSLKARVAFPSEEAALKVMYLALGNVIRKWEHSIHWKAALNCFTLLWEDRIRAANGM
jgi:transposase-like protein